MHPEVRKGWEEVKRLLDGGDAVIIAGGEVYGLPSLHNFYPKRYYASIRHVGFGFFEGRTERGEFSFDGGGAMRHFQGGEGAYLSYSPLRASAEVLEDLGYDLEAARARVDEILEGAQ